MGFTSSACHFSFLLVQQYEHNNRLEYTFHTHSMSLIVRKGGAQSQILFTIYLDEFISGLTHSKLDASFHDILLEYLVMQMMLFCRPPPSMNLVFSFLFLSSYQKITILNSILLKLS